MKRIICLLILMFSFMNVCLAVEPANLISLTNKCSVINDSEVTIHVEVVSINEGLLAKLTDKFIMGRITNRKDMIVSFSEIESNYTTQVILDTLRDENERSNLNIYFDKDIILDKNEQLLSFNINIKFLEDIPDSLYVLGNEILLSSDESVCENINGYKTEVINLERNFEQHMTGNVIIGVLVLICLIEFMIILINFRKR